MSWKWYVLDGLPGAYVRVSWHKTRRSACLRAGEGGLVEDPDGQVREVVRCLDGELGLDSREG